jgi:O-antigen/teichoic acid export membrane protein
MAHCKTGQVTMTRTKNTFRNTAVSVGGYLLIFLFGIAIRKLFLENIDFENLGYEGLFSTIFFVLNTLDLGAGSVLLYRLYRDLSGDKEASARRTIQIFARLYRWVALIILLAGIGAMPFLRYLIRDSVSDWGYVYTIYLIQLLGSVGIVYLTYYRLLLQASQRLSDAVTIETIVRIAFQVSKAFIIVYTKDYILYTIAAVMCNLLSAILVARRSRARFPALFAREDVTGWYRDKRFRSELLSASVLRFTQTAYYLTDTILVSAVLGIRAVALYGNYTMIGASILVGFKSILHPVSGSAGNYANTEDPVACYRMFRMIDLIGFSIASFVFASLCTLFQPVVSFLYGTQYLLPFSFVVVYGLYCYLFLKDNSIRVFRETLGKYADQRNWALSAACANIVFSLLGIRLWGITGVLTGTVLSALLTQIGDYTVACRYRFFQPLHRNLLRSYGFLLLAFAEMALTVLLSWNLPVSIGGIALRCLLCLIIPNAINLILFRKTDAFQQMLSYWEKMVRFVFKRAEDGADD